MEYKSILPLVTALLALSGCAAPSLSDKDPTAQMLRCGMGCRIEMELPPGNARPTIPPGQEYLGVAGGNDDFVLELCRQGSGPAPNPCRPFTGNVFLIFPQETPFRAAEGPPGHGEPLYVIRISGGRNVFRTRPNEICDNDGSCKNICTAEGDCKYIIVETNKPTRQPLDPWIILF